MKPQRFVVYCDHPKGYLKKITWGDPEKTWGDLEDARRWKTRAGVKRYLKKLYPSAERIKEVGGLPPGLRQFQGLNIEIKEIEITIKEV